MSDFTILDHVADAADEPEEAVEDDATSGETTETDTAQVAEGAEGDSPEAPPTSESEGDAPEGEAPDESQNQAEPEKKGVQKRIDELVREREDARREAEYWRNKVNTTARETQPDTSREGKTPTGHQETKPPQESEFNTYEEYQEARVRWITEEAIRKERESMRREYEEEIRRNEAAARIEEGRKTYPDFDSVAMTVPFTDTVSDIIIGSKQMAHIAYYLGKHPEIVRHINSLSPLDAAREIGIIEARLESVANPGGSNAQPGKKPIKTAEPVKPITPSAGSEKKLEDMSMEEYERYRLAQMRKR
ncbi:MAG: hypothetical protein J7M24_00280 [Candidatus Latescibacteria bacterium]|nr:hypothetical protein [Candidatus Latescibacterota bacterium]